MKKFFIGIAVSLLASSVAMAQTPAAAPGAGNAENGKKLFVTYLCWSCHGSSGRAGGAAAPGADCGAGTGGAATGQGALPYG